MNKIKKTPRKDKSEWKQVCIQASDETWNKVKECAKKNGVFTSDVLETIINDSIDQY